MSPLIDCLPLMEVDIIRTISLFKRIFPTRMWSFLVKMNVQSVSESLFSMEQIQKQVISLKSSEVYLSIDINVCGCDNQGELKKNSFRNATYCRNSVHLWGHGAVNRRA